MIQIPEYMVTPHVDLGDDHYFWMSDTQLSGEYAHPNAQTGEFCMGGMNFRPGGWTLHSVEPLTISPSLLCSCGDHGFIREGRWVPA